MINYKLGIAIFILLVFGGKILKTNAQESHLNNLNSSLNGLFSPNATERFFREGREDFDREIEIINNPEIYFDDNLLQIDEELIEQIRENQQKKNREELIF